MPLPIPIDNELGAHELPAEIILLGLTREEWAEYREALREYVRWLLAKRDRPNQLTEFDARLKKSDATLDGQVAAGEMTETQANQTKGDRIWWRAFEETRGASGWLALAKILERDMTKYLKGEPVRPGEDFDEIRTEFEGELAAKLRQLLHRNGK